MPGLFRSAIVAGLAIAMSVLPGCGKSANTPPPKSPVRQIDPTNLPALGEYVPPLDGGRIEIAGPAGWQLAARTKGYVVRFVADSNDSYPMILVKADDSATEPLTLDNVVAFASALAADGSAQPVAIGKRFGALQLKRGKEPNTVDRILEQLIFTTVLGGRTYMLELRTRQDRVGEDQEKLFAVAAGMREAATPSEGAEGGVTAPPAVPEAAKATTDGVRKELDEIFE